ncbi:MAG: tyrosine-type recombinase/integrase [Acidimicrobiales bacterium]
MRAYPPGRSHAFWRIRWEEAGRHRDTSARSRTEAIAKAIELVERLGRGTATDLGRATGADLVAHYLDPARRPARVERWSDRHRDEQIRYCERYVLPVVGTVACRRLTRVELQRVLDQAPTASVAQHLRRCLTGVVNAGLEEGHLLARQDVLRGVRWRPAERDTPAEPAGRAVTEAEIPTTAAVHALAGATAGRSGVWWRELEILVVAYSGMRWGEHVALTAERVDLPRRRISVDRQVIETRSALKETLPKGRRQRVTMFPALTPAGVDLAALVERRLAEVPDDGLVFPAPQGGWARRSNYGRNTWDPAAVSVEWPRRNGRWAWSFHSLRHVFATWALNQPGLRLEDVSRLLGHSSVRVTQEVYIHVHGDLYQRFFDATA